jgi:hypothetical protein
VSTPMTREQSLVALRELMRDAVKETQRQDRKWNELNDQFMAKIREENRVRALRGMEPHSLLSIKDQKAAWIELNDAFAAGNWWRDKATYLAAVIQAELAMKEAGL